MQKLIIGMLNCMITTLISNSSRVLKACLQTLFSRQVDLNLTQPNPLDMEEYGYGYNIFEPLFNINASSGKNTPVYFL